MPDPEGGRRDPRISFTKAGLEGFGKHAQFPKVRFEAMSQAFKSCRKYGFCARNVPHG